jgi:formylglycine-generating enzyme required for sulfatase activity
VEQVLYKALAKKPEERYASMGEFAAALEGLANPRKSAQPAEPAPAAAPKLPSQPDIVISEETLPGIPAPSIQKAPELVAEEKISVGLPAPAIQLPRPAPSPGEDKFPPGPPAAAGEEIIRASVPQTPSGRQPLPGRRKWAVSTAILLLVLVAVIGLGGTGVSQGQHGLGPLAFLATGTPTRTPIPSFTTTTTSTSNPTVTATPTAKFTQLSTDDPMIPLAVASKFTSMVTPNAGVIFSPMLEFSQTIEGNQPVNPTSVFANPVSKLYGAFSYDKMNSGVQWSAVWYLLDDNSLVCYETKPWDGGTGGYGYTSCTPPSELWQPGNYEVRIYVGLILESAGRFSITGQPVTLSPAPTLAIKSTKSPKDGMEMVYVPAGNFLMGSDKTRDSQASSDEYPQHTVYLDAFWIDQTEVTNVQYSRCVVDAKCTLPHDARSFTRSSYYGNSEYANYPVIYVDWSQAQAYCAWARRKLPSEAEWEKAARGTNGQLYPWGDAVPDQDKLNYSDVLKGDTTKVYNYFPSGASSYGAVDMAGNVWEWVSDWFSSIYYPNSPDKNPMGPDLGVYRTLRGGSWGDNSRLVRSAYREGLDPSRGSNSIGFRCAAGTSP